MAEENERDRDLREHVRATLPMNVLALMDELEHFAQIPIGVVFGLPADPTALLETNALAPAVIVRHNLARIHLQTLQPDPQGFLHELLHIQRYWIEGVPQIVPIGNDDAHWHITSAIENALEHLVIVPRETEYGFDPHGYWNDIYRIIWSAYPWPTMTKGFPRRQHSLLAWATTAALSNDPAVHDLARASLVEEGLFNEAEKFRARLDALRGDKERSIACVVRFLGIPRHEAHLMRLDVRARARTTSVIPHR